MIDRRLHPAAPRGGFTVIELTMVVAMIAVLISLLLPAVQQAREGARRMQCKNNLLNIGLALQQYVQTYDRFPPGCVNATAPVLNTLNDQPMSWITQILPYLEAPGTWRKVDFTQPVFAPANAAARASLLTVVLCPSSYSATQVLVIPLPKADGEEETGEVDVSDLTYPFDSYGMYGGQQGDPRNATQTSYAACHHDVEALIDVAQNGVLFLNSGVRWRDITDGRSQTILVGETSGDLVRNGGWMLGNRSTLRNTGTPLTGPPMTRGSGISGQIAWEENIDTLESANLYNASDLPQTDWNRWVGGFGSLHTGGANFLFADGSVRLIGNNIDGKLYRNLGNRHDGNLVSFE